MPTGNLISSECQQPTFPIEIFQLIIDNLHSANDYHTAAECQNLKSCSLVCRSWVPLCQRHIFALVHIGFNYSLDNVPSGKNLVVAFNKSPSLSTHIRTLIYSFRDISHERKHTDPSFIAFLQLPRVQRLQIYSHNRRSSFDEASEHSFGFRPLLIHYLSTGRLTMLHLFGILDLPIHNILAISSLKSLRLFNCSLQSIQECTPFESSLKFLRVDGAQGLSWSSFRHCPQLETLCTHNSGENMSDVTLCAIEETFPDLKHLVLTTFSMEYASQPANDTLTNTDHHLEHLTLSPWCSFEDPLTSDIDKYLLRYSKSLKTLDLHIKIKGHSSTIVDLICDPLSGIRGNNILQKMELIFFYNPPPLPISEKLVLDLEHWRRFAALITDDPSSFPALRHISLHIALQEQPSYGPGYTADRAELAEFRRDIGRALNPIMRSPHIAFHGTVKLHRGSTAYSFPDNFNDY